LAQQEADVRFEIAHQVTIEAPVEAVFSVLAFADGLESLLRLSDLVTSFTLLDVRAGTTPEVQVIDFEFGERVPVLPGGLMSSDMVMRVEQTVDVAARRVDYRSRSKVGIGITVHKIRTFEAVGDATRVSEVVHGDAPPGIHLLARRTARKAHVEHMESYQRLFPAP
jgi:hypothetical protein